jgi:RNA polymerase sigma factor (sigma-70 family)
MDDDVILLRRFAEENSEEAFTALVQRYVDLVYSAALRRTNGDAHRAADVSQEVFTALARQARRLSRHPVLSAWLHTATRNIAVNIMTSEQRRKARELAAMALHAAQGSDASPEWERVRPMLDAAIDRLPEPDRVAVVLRFLERRPFAEVGAALQVSADAARMRTDRAVEKLRDLLAQRGITSTSSALGLLLSAHTAGAAPAGLAATLAPAAFSAASVGAASVSTGIFLVSMKTVLSGVAVVGALGLGFYLGFSRAASEPLPALPETPHQVETIAALRRENAGLRAEVDRLAAANALKTPPRAAAPINPPPSARSAPLPAPLPAFARANQAKAMLNNLRQFAAAIDQFVLENKRPPASLDEIVGETKYIRRVNPVAGESYAALDLSGKGLLTLTTPDGVTVSYDPAGKNVSNSQSLQAEAQAAEAEAQQILIQRFGREFVQRVTGSIQMAVSAYAAANNGKRPPSLDAAIPYFATPQEGADFVEFAEVAKALGMKF